MKLRAFLRSRAAQQNWESLTPDPSVPAEWFVGSEEPDWILCFTKGFLVEQWRRRSVVPGDCAIAIRYGMPTRGFLRMLRAMAKHWNTGVLFVGDLDPLDLGVYWALRESLNAIARPIAFGGIDDGWLTLCERRLKPKFGFHNVTIRMSAFERKHLAAVESALDIERTVGARAAALLRSGRKLELEGASNPEFYEKRHTTELLHHMRRLARQKLASRHGRR